MTTFDMSQLKAYVSGGAPRPISATTILLDITHNLLASRFIEIPFDASNTVQDVKQRVYGMTGSSVAHMRLYINGDVELLESDNKLLGEYAHTGDALYVVDEDPFSNARNGAMDDVSQVKKFELSEEEYDKRENTYRAYKKKMLAQDPNWKSLYQLNAERARVQREEARAASRAQSGLFSLAEDNDAILARIAVGQRCIVAPGERRGTVMYIGAVPELPNTPSVIPADGSAPQVTTDLWVGIQLDEPVGKHDGMVRGKRYFTCNHHAGIFARPAAVKTGDYPEVDPFASDDEDEGDKNEKKEDNNNDVYEEL